MLRSKLFVILLGSLGLVMGPDMRPHEVLPFLGAADVSPRDLVVLRAARLERLAHARRAPRAAGREGDWVLRGTNGTALTFADANLPKHRPLRGALVDFSVGRRDRTDPLLWFRPGWIDGRGQMHPLVATEVLPAVCGHGVQGLRARGVVDDVRLDTLVCPLSKGRYRFETIADGLPRRAIVADDLSPGSAPVLTDRTGGHWDGTVKTRWLASTEGRLSYLLDTGPVTVQRKLVRISGEVFNAPIAIKYVGRRVVRTVHVLEGDQLDAVARAPILATPWRAGFANGAPGLIEILARKHVVASGRIRRGDPRTVHLSRGFGEEVRLKDENGVISTKPVALGSLRRAPDTLARVEPPKRGTIRLSYRDRTGRPVPVHVMFSPRGGTPMPKPIVAADEQLDDRERRVVTAGASLYLLDGAADVVLAPGHYVVTANHGPAFSIARDHVDLQDGHTVYVYSAIDRVIDTDGWTSADFHLHAAPSPDAPVSLRERITSLVCEGVDVAVATDHNHVTDYGPLADAMGVRARGKSVSRYAPTWFPTRARGSLTTIVGDEITSRGRRLWGHFNAFPLSAGQEPWGGPIPAYYDATPHEMFESARELGARVIQVNHPRMQPRIGYFDLTDFDADSGEAGPSFDDDFDAVEAFNGLWLQKPDRIRRDVKDAIALARRGKRVTLTGNSDSHQLLYQEAGYPRTYVHTPREPIETREGRVIAALLRGQTSVSSGPLVEMTVNGKPIGSTVRPDKAGKVRVWIRISAPEWVPVERVELWIDDRVVKKFPASRRFTGPVRFETTIDVRIMRDSTLLAWAEATKPLPHVTPYSNARAIGFTSLTYVDADGDGRVKIKKKHEGRAAHPLHGQPHAHEKGKPHVHR